MQKKRVILIVLDSVGIGALPDASAYGDAGANTLGHIAEYYPDLQIPNLIAMGLGNIDPTNTLPKVQHPTAAFGKAAEQSAGKDTTTGHWEIAGLISENPFPTFPDGFPTQLISHFEDTIGIGTLGNIAASGTVIINELGDAHLRTRKPIVYTSADSVFQIAMHEEIYPIERQYEICTIARRLLVDDYAVGRVIARPFVGESGNYIRTSRRKDFSLAPPDNLLDALIAADRKVHAVGKITDIFAGKGITTAQKTANNTEGVQYTIQAMSNGEHDLIFTNLVDFDMLYGHRRDIPGYAQCLMEFDRQLPEITAAMSQHDLLILTADHGNDPSAPGSDHTREYVPILLYGSDSAAGNNFGTRHSFADIAATIADYLYIDFSSPGTSFLGEI